MKKYKYITRTYSALSSTHSNFEDWLNSYGKEGWKVVSVNRYNGIDFPACVVFEKEIKDIEND